MITTGNSVFLRLTTDFSNQGRGFDIQYDTICNRKITSHRGVIESPNYPTNYPNNLDCEWIIEAPQGNKIFVAFSAFNLEYIKTDLTACAFDYLRIEQRNQKTVLQSEQFCENMPKPFTSFSEIVAFKYF